MVRIEETSIQVTRGDTCRFTIIPQGRELPADATALFTVKQTPWIHDKSVIQKEVPVIGGKIHIFLNPEDTDLKPGEYVWDVRIAMEEDDIKMTFTPMEYARFAVLEAIGDE